MQVSTGLQLDEFLEQTRAYLEREKLVHSFILSLAERHLKSGKSVHRTFLVSDQNVQLAAIQTESNRALIVSAGAEPAVAELARYIKANQIAVPGIYSVAEVVEQFSREAEARVINSTQMRLFRLLKVIPPRSTTGLARFAKLSDVDTIMQWRKEFQEEAVPHDPVKSDQALRQHLLDTIEQKLWFIWEDEGHPVCMVGSQRETATDRWIAPVYTPKKFRGKGYGSALTAYVSQKILDSGKVAMLNTDLANPTSNSIYQKIGYEPIADFGHDIYSSGAGD